jgi:O-antigen biosynthesis protein
VNVVIIGSVWPEPSSSAAGSHMMQLITLLQQSGKQIIFASTAAHSDHAIDLSAFDIKTKSVKMNCDSFDEWISTLSPEMVIFDRFMVEEQFGWRVAKTCPNAMRVLNTEDLHCLRRAREAQVKISQQVASRLSTAELQNDDALREIAAIYRCDCSLMISEVEIELLHSQFAIPKSQLIYFPFLFDGCVPSSPDFELRKDFMTIGNFRHAPNWDAVQWLRHEIWPIIRKQLPNAKLNIYGAYPPKKATQLHQPKIGFHVLGWTDDIQAVFQQARVCIAPLRFGAGLKGKLYESMIYGTPSVTTSIGAEGFIPQGADLDWNGYVTDEIDSFVEAAVSLYTHQQQWEQAQDSGYQLLSERFEREFHQQQIVQSIEAIYQQLTKHRQENFIGQLLNHHQHRSTEFMSRWIQEKERH